MRQAYVRSFDSWSLRDHCRLLPALAVRDSIRVCCFQPRSRLAESELSQLGADRGSCYGNDNQSSQRTADGTVPDGLESLELCRRDSCLASQADCAFVAKREVASWPILGPICRAMNTIFIDRRLKTRYSERHAANRSRRCRRGLGVVLFAEGTKHERPARVAFQNIAAGICRTQSVASALCQRRVCCPVMVRLPRRNRFVGGAT